MSLRRPRLTLSLFVVLVAAFSFGLALVPAPAQAFCDFTTAGCPGSHCITIEYQCNCTGPGGKPRLEAIWYCTDDPSIVLGRGCTNDHC
jgi:hypothetical protein